MRPEIGWYESIELITRGRSYLSFLEDYFIFCFIIMKIGFIAF